MDKFMRLEPEKMSKAEYLHWLQDRAGVSFMVSIPAPTMNGTKILSLTAEELGAYLEDYNLFLANYYELSVPDFVDWHYVDKMAVRCPVEIGEGERCNMVIPGTSPISPEKWKALRGTRCEKHAKPYLVAENGNAR